MGSMIAQIVAARYPERCRHLTLIMSNSGERRTLLPAPKALKALIEVQHSPDRQASRQYCRLFCHRSLPPLDEERLRRLGGLAYDRGRTPEGLPVSLQPCCLQAPEATTFKNPRPTLLIPPRRSSYSDFAGKRIKVLLPKAEHCGPKAWDMTFPPLWPTRRAHHGTRVQMNNAIAWYRPNPIPQSIGTISAVLMVAGVIIMAFESTKAVESLKNGVTPPS